MNDQPLISCFCVTHGRPHVLEEAIESYRRQTFKGPTEMVILNDCPEQPLIEPDDAPGVRVINLPAPVEDLSLKYDMCCVLCRGRWLAFWDDDDISLPFRLEFSLRRCEEKKLSLFKQHLAWFWNSGEITDFPGNLFMGSSLFTRDFYLASGRPPAGSIPDVTAWVQMTTAAKDWVNEDPKPEEAFFIYRWAGVGFHCSGGNESMVERHRLMRQWLLADPSFKRGPWKLRPHWNQDYVALVTDAIKKGVGK